MRARMRITFAVPSKYSNIGGGITKYAPASPIYTDNIQNKPGTGGSLFYIGTDGAGSHSHSVGGSFSGSGSGDQGTRSGGTADAGDGTGHENVQPTVMIPYIVYLSG